MVKVWKEEYIPLDELPTEYMCVWKGCTAHFNIKNGMPHGWVWLITYWSPAPQLVPFTVPQKDMPRDAVLCPKHNHTLEQLLYETSRRLREPPAGSA
jgi:hypothetical protein